MNDAPRPQAPNAKALDRAVRHIIRKNAEFARERAFAKIVITYANGELEKVSEERHYKPGQLPAE